VSGIFLEVGTLTYLERRITDGRGRLVRALWTSKFEDPAKTVALSFNTKIRARLNDTTPNGSYPAFRTKVLKLPPNEKRATKNGDALLGVAALRGYVGLKSKQCVPLSTNLSLGYCTLMKNRFESGNNLENSYL
jgi:hypothetical protein